MKFTRSMVVAFLAVLPLACSSLPSGDSSAFTQAVPGDPMKVVVHKLDNGLTVMLSENH